MTSADPEERLEIERRSLEDLLSAGMAADDTAEYSPDLSESLRRNMRAELGAQAMDAEKERLGTDALFTAFNQAVIVALCTGWDSRLPGGQLAITAECSRDKAGHWGISGVRLAPAPMPRRHSDSGKMPRMNVLRDVGDR